MQSKQDQIVSDYLKQIEDMKDEHTKELITVSNLRDTVTVPKCVSNKNTGSSGVSAKTSNKSNLKCYTESELLRKVERSLDLAREEVERSLDLAREADELAVKYNALLKVCSEQKM